MCQIVNITSKKACTFPDDNYSLSMQHKRERDKVVCAWRLTCFTCGCVYNILFGRATLHGVPGDMRHMTRLARAWTYCIYFRWRLHMSSSTCNVQRCIMMCSMMQTAAAMSRYGLQRLFAMDFGPGTYCAGQCSTTSRALRGIEVHTSSC